MIKSSVTCVGVSLHPAGDVPYKFTFYGGYPIRDVMLFSSSKESFKIGKEYTVTIDSKV